MEETQGTAIEAAEVEEQTEATAVEETEETIADDSGADIPKPKGVQRRINELVREREEERRRAERLEAMLHEVYTKQHQPAPPQEAPRPTREQFNYDEEAYTEALAEWKADQVVKTRLEHEARAAQERQQQEQARRAAQTYQEKAQEVYRQGLQKHADFDLTVDRAVSAGLITPAMGEAIVYSDAAADLAYYIATHPQEGQRIASLPPIAQVKELARLEMKLSAPKIPKPSSAPDPIKPVGESAPATFDPDKLPIEEWVKLRNEGKIK